MKIWKLQGNLILITSSFFLILPLKLYSQDIIYCIDGRVMKSIIKKIEGDNITYSYFTDKNNVPYEISTANVHSGIFGAGSVWGNPGPLQTGGCADRYYLS